jgi:hypothetical protein
MQRFSACGSTVYLSATPVRMVHFIGGFTFGSLPQIFYRRLAEALCSEKHYSVVLHPFPFNPFVPDHWNLALALYERLRTLQLRDLPRLSDNNPFYLKRNNHVWLGHSLGCKLIELLELLSLPPDTRHAALREILSAAETHRIERLIGDTVSRLKGMASQITPEAAATADENFSLEWNRQLTRRKDGEPLQFILDQASVLMAPQISGATRIAATNLRLYNAGVQPSWEQTCYLVRSQCSIFHLTEMIRFSDDTIAADDIIFLEQVLTARHHSKDCDVVRDVPGGHLRPLCPTPALLDAIEASIASRLPKDSL